MHINLKKKEISNKEYLENAGMAYFTYNLVKYSNYHNMNNIVLLERITKLERAVGALMGALLGLGLVVGLFMPTPF